MDNYKVFVNLVMLIQYKQSVQEFLDYFNLRKIFTLKILPRENLPWQCIKSWTKTKMTKLLIKINIEIYQRYYLL